MATENKSKLLLIDADFILWTATMGNKIFDDAGGPIKEDDKFIYTPKTESEVYECADSIIANMFTYTSPNYYIGYLGNSRSFRYDYYPEYKGNRKDKVLPPYYNELKDYLNIKWNFILLNNTLEADDAVNILKNRYKDQYDIIIATTDKDLIKSITGTYLNTKNFEVIKTSNAEANRFFWESMVCGDTADHIKGLIGRGQKFATKILDLADELHTNYAMEILNQYIIHYKDELTGIDEFYKNYRCLKILDESPLLDIPVLNKVTVERAGVEW